MELSWGKTHCRHFWRRGGRDCEDGGGHYCVPFVDHHTNGTVSQIRLSLGSSSSSGCSQQILPFSTPVVKRSNTYFSWANKIGISLWRARGAETLSVVFLVLSCDDKIATLFKCVMGKSHLTISFLKTSLRVMFLMSHKTPVTGSNDIIVIFGSDAFRR